jgi:hypothetical protein
MARFADDADRRATETDAVRKLLDAKGQLFARDDPWLDAVMRILKRTQ